MQIKRWLVLVGMLAAFGCVGPWVTESNDIPVIDDGQPQIEKHYLDHSQLDVSTSGPAGILPSTGRSKVGG